MVKPFESEDLIRKVRSLLSADGVVWMDDYTSVTSRRSA